MKTDTIPCGHTVRLRIFKTFKVSLAVLSLSVISLTGSPIRTLASDQVLVGVGAPSAAETEDTPAQGSNTGMGDSSPEGGNASPDITASGSNAEEDSALLGGADYNGGLTMLGSGSTLTVENTKDEYEWVKTNMAGRFMPYVITHAEGNPNVIHFLYMYGHDAQSPDTFSYTDEERAVFGNTEASADTAASAEDAASADAASAEAAAADAASSAEDAASASAASAEAASADAAAFAEDAASASAASAEAASSSTPARGTAANVPLLMQWDYRWGFPWYGGGPIGLTACAPTCMTMIGLGLTGKDTYTVPDMCRYAEDNGYWVDGSGTSWGLVTNAFPDDPIACQTLSVDEGSITYALLQGYPVLINVGIGKFSAVGHFMVLTGLDKDGNFILRDPNNLENSSKTWPWSELQGEIQAAWCYSIS